MTPGELIERTAQAMYYAAPRDQSFDEALGLRELHLGRAAKAVRIALEAAVEAVRSETLEDPQDDGDDAYNDAIVDAVSAIHALLPQEDGE